MTPPATPPPSARRRFGRFGKTLKQTEAFTDRVITGGVLPAWKQATRPESRWPASVAVLAALTLQFTLPATVQLRHRWILPVVGVLLLIVLVAANPKRIDNETPSLRLISTVLIGWISAANALSGGRLVVSLVDGNHWAPRRLLLTGAAIWLTNVIAFALWYWHFDRGGPVGRAHARNPYPDFLFPQMQEPSLAPEGWDAQFHDYLYTSFTNAAAFSPTDVLPLTGWAKLTMMLQAALSLSVVALVVARAVNILG